MSEIKISYVIVNWNGKSVLKGCLDSLQNESEGINYEIIVVDNNSNDGSQELLKKQYSNIILIENKDNLGFSKANNIGIAKSRGELLFLVNSDIIALENSIKNMLDYMDENPEVGMAGPKVFNHDMTKQTTCSKYPGLWNELCGAFALNKVFSNTSLFSDWRMDYWDHMSERSVSVLSGCFWAIRRTALDDVGLLDERFFIYGEDVDWSRRFNNSKWKVKFNPEARIIHLGGASSSRTPIRFYIEMQKANLKYWKKHHSRVKVMAYKLILFIHHLNRVSARVIILLLKFKLNEIYDDFKIKRSLAVLKWLPAS